MQLPVHLCFQSAALRIYVQGIVFLRKSRSRQGLPANGGLELKNTQELGGYDRRARGGKVCICFPALLFIQGKRCRSRSRREGMTGTRRSAKRPG
eukprot:scaffold63813_cov15-Tisochrysis_lutea.AAC.1